MANKTCTFSMPEEIWQVLKLISSEGGESTKTIVNAILKKNLNRYAKEKEVSSEMLALIEEKLKAVEE
jgi:hypothetical protein